MVETHFFSYNFRGGLVITKVAGCMGSNMVRELFSSNYSSVLSDSCLGRTRFLVVTLVGVLVMTKVECAWVTT